MKKQKTDLKPGIEIELLGETHELRYCLRAFEVLKLNPFKPNEIGDHLKAITPEGAAAWIRAGLLWQYRKDGSKHGQQPPAVEDVLDVLNHEEFLDIINRQLDAETAYRESKRPAAPSTEPAA